MGDVGMAIAGEVIKWWLGICVAFVALATLRCRIVHKSWPWEK